MNIAMGIICLLSAAINLPGISAGQPISIFAGIFCLCCALFCFFLGN